jgi:hypothetical protein
MKAGFIYILLILLFFKGSVFFAQPAKGYATYSAESIGGHCSQTVRLFTDSTYCYERGCEATSYFSFGKWKLRNDTLLFFPVQPAGYRVIDTVIASRTHDKKISVSLFDRSGINITGRVLAMHYVKNIGFYDMPADSAKQIRTEIRRRDGAIVLKPLQRLFQQRLLIPVDSVHNQYTIRLNLSAQWNFQAYSAWTDLGGFTLLKRKGQLVSILPDQFDEKGVLKPTVYERKEW